MGCLSRPLHSTQDNQKIPHPRQVHAYRPQSPLHSHRFPLVQCIIRGIKRFHGEKDRKPKQPIPLPVLTDILAHLQPEAKPGHIATYTACCVAFSGLLRCSEFTTKSADKAFSPAFQLSQASVQFFPGFYDASHAILFLPASETDPFRKGASVRLTAAPGKPTGPIAALKTLIPNGAAPEVMLPLFPSPDDPSKLITCAFFISTIREALTSAGYDPTFFAGHSFR